MVRLVVIALLVLLSVANLAPNMQGLQLVKIPTLVEHVEDHYGENWTWTNLKDFVVDHYMNAKLPYEKEHKNLPFKTTVNTPTVIASTYAIPNIVEQIEFIEDKNCLGFSLIENHGSSIIDQIWTPPKQA